ncbi:HI0074 family nucleotidyltransferase substrate-binding subunit [Sulfurihydrogenibium azorense]|uniref:Nucleotidyltransferase substrate-binding protein n=1 Tax=Sulfurihydrogenibium azorense (strain DSM 15241 / OCM 825 / Az-Fu1) TaxID=204536 RepID=C1DTP5_SULAA|nr:HI0074 family nucleotidyltransferase substrate-binding subunit [Sulfurihydrogenibium azorense]ACN99695.1 nucleotidyltransferase substrate-binding protein [Sulfurihydrogenibium azorense Az-Fu1]MDM7274458.1 HI0074 family nucleotidyltransferase substrate-binding subunit [Sulfurihydrogenibium azorense]
MEKFARSFERFKKAYRKFEEVVNNPFLPDIFKDEFLIEITTKRFEYTYEALWKTIKEFLRLRGLECNSPKSCFKEAFKEGLITTEYEEVIFDMIVLRNNLVHVYDEEMAKEIYSKIEQDKFLKAFKTIINKIEEIIQNGV